MGRKLNKRQIAANTYYAFVARLFEHLIEQYADEFGSGNRVTFAIKGDVWATYCKYYGIKARPSGGWDIGRLYVQFGTDSIDEVVEHGWVEYDKGARYLRGRRPDGLEGLYFLVAHEFAHALHAARGAKGWRRGCHHPRQYWQVLDEVHQLFPCHQMLAKFRTTARATPTTHWKREGELVVQKDLDLSY